MKKNLLWIVLAVPVVLVLASKIAEKPLEAYIQKELSRQSQMKVTFSDMRLRLWRGSVAFKDVHVQPLGQGLAPEVNVAWLRVHFQLWPLLQKKLVVQNLETKNGVVRFPASWRELLALACGQGVEPAKEERGASAQKLPSLAAGVFFVEDLRIEKVSVFAKDLCLGFIDQMEVEHVGDMQQPLNLSLNMFLLNDRKSPLFVKGSVQQRPEGLKIVAWKQMISDWPLSELKVFLPTVANLEGEWNMESSLSKDEILNVDLNIKNLKYEGAGVSPELALLGQLNPNLKIVVEAKHLDLSPEVSVRLPMFYFDRQGSVEGIHVELEQSAPTKDWILEHVAIENLEYNYLKGSDPLKSFKALGAIGVVGTGLSSSKDQLPATSAARSVSSMVVKNIELKKGRVLYTDWAAPDAKHLEFSDIHIEGKDFYWGQPRWSSFDVQARVANQGTLSLKGQWIPCPQPLSLSYECGIENVPAVAITAFLPEDVPVSVQSGAVALHSRGDVKEGFLRSNNRVTLKGLELVPQSGAVLGYPLTDLLPLLADQQGEIALNFNVDQDLNNPNWELSPIVRDVVIRGLLNKLVTNPQSLKKLGESAFLKGAKSISAFLPSVPDKSAEAQSSSEQAPSATAPQDAAAPVKDEREAKKEELKAMGKQLEKQFKSLFRKEE